jgi:hypothetical protein
MWRKRRYNIRQSRVSHIAVRNILREHGIEWRQSKTDLWSSNRSRDPEYDLKKKHVEELKNCNLCNDDSILLLQDEKGPNAVNTYGGTSWYAT